MIIRHTTPSDSDQIYDMFQAAQVSARDPARDRIKNGFFEYRLRYGDIATRVDSPFSFVAQDNGRIISYLLAYQLGKRAPVSNDPVLDSVRHWDASVVYIDQLFLQPDAPLPLVARFADTAEYVWRMEKVPGVVTAIPVQPWRNVSSARLALARGFTRAGVVQDPKLTLAVYSKPYLPLDNPFEGMGDHLLQPSSRS